MEQKDMYTLRELFEELGISIAELGRRSGISEITVAKIRDGKSARRSTVVNLLRTLSEIYGVKLSLSNVSGIVINDKLARTASRTTEKAEKAVEEAKARQARFIAEKAEKRVYNRTQGKDLPDGCIPATEFARNHGRNDRSFRDDMLIGRGPGTIPGEETHPTLPVKDHVDYSERPKPGRPHEKEKYLTQDQQLAAFEFWKRHSVSFAECHHSGCWCHIVLQENN